MGNSHWMLWRVDLGWWPVTHQLLSHYSCLMGQGENRVIKLLSWDKDIEIAYQLLSQAKHARLGEDGKVGVAKVYCHFVRSRQKWNALSPFFFLRLSLTPLFLTFVLLSSSLEGWGIEVMIICSWWFLSTLTSSSYISPASAWLLPQAAVLQSRPSLVQILCESCFPQGLSTSSDLGPPEATEGICALAQTSN